MATVGVKGLMFSLICSTDRQRCGPAVDAAGHDIITILHHSAGLW